MKLTKAPQTIRIAGKCINTMPALYGNIAAPTYAMPTDFWQWQLEGAKGDSAFQNTYLRL